MGKSETGADSAKAAIVNLVEKLKQLFKKESLGKQEPNKAADQKNYIKPENSDEGTGTNKKGDSASSKKNTNDRLIKGYVGEFIEMPTPYNPLTPKNRKNLKEKLENRTITPDEYKHFAWDKRFANRRRRGVNRFWSEEIDRVKLKKPTRNWNEEQLADIENGKTPAFNGEPLEGHHKYNALNYPQLADNPDNIYAATNNEHFNRWHNANWQNSTHGYPLNPNFQEEF